ncbi:MAG: type II toxin-antitoxin system HicB family antitoxin [Burkholderiales bacterium]|nr:type II toxin-antitoxin system HicB family antitoxin [Burkholderiales bacterium]
MDLDLSQLSDKRIRINVTLPVRILHRLDRAAKEAGTSRSGYIAQLVLASNSIGKIH